MMQIPQLDSPNKSVRATHRSTYIFLYLVGSLNVMLWVFSLLGEVEFLQRMGINLYSAFFGLLLLLCAFFVQRKSVAALIVAIAALSLDALAGLVMGLLFGGSVNVVGIVVRGVFVAALISGIKATMQLRMSKDPAAS